MSRRRKGAKPSQSGQRVLRTVQPAAPEEPCDCPNCSGAELDLEDLANTLVGGAGELLKVDDPLDAEFFAAGFLAIGAMAGETFDEALQEGILPAVARHESSEALAVLIALDAVGAGPVAGDAAARLERAGLALPSWAGELRGPVRLGQSLRFADSDGDASMLVCTFERAGRGHGFVVHADHTDCDAAAEIALFPTEVLDEVLEEIRSDARHAGLTVTSEVLDPAELRWQIERALDAREVHDLEDGDPEPPSDILDEENDEDVPDYHLLAVLLRARIRTLPEPTRPPAPHGSTE
ncbi:hypothetical protein Ahu01nite_088540 [Winogradskya humida]|uniref:Uncharacterized protein n=1 Tax=Winogradskya humida TaxID=113566 RepID=A0ABQ4A4I4_9ACTN|nr:hypothetical protein Ahu01nite_088540 [Actinoplanes humidus]